jgi:tetratricopeptide (TPR) repeat protein
MDGTLGLMGELARCEKQFYLAERHYIESLTIRRELKSPPRAIGFHLFNLGQTLLMRDQLDQATNYLNECLNLGQRINSPELICCALEGLADAASAQQEPERAAKLWAVAEILRESLGMSLAIPDRFAHDHFVNLARKQTDERTFNVAWAEGRKMVLEQAVVYALEDV